MNSKKDIEQKLETLSEALGSRDSFVNDVMTRIEDSPVQPGNVTEASSFGNKTAKPNHVLRRILMKNTVKFTAAAVILIAATLALTVFDKTVLPTYALEQTMEALHSVQTIHIREYHSDREEPILIWAEFLPNGQPKQIRLNIPEWDSPTDGPKEIVWSNNEAQVWFKKKNSLLTIKETKLAEQIKHGMEKGDPKFLLEKLKYLQQNGKIQLTIEHPEDIAIPITVTAVFVEPDPLLGKQLIAQIDQATRLVLSLELNVERENEEKTITMEYFDYNQPIDASMFTFENVPDDVYRNDQIANPVGLPQGTMTKDEVAVEVVCQFWQAVIDKDYDTASQLYDGIAAERLKEGFGKLENYNVEIVSVGPVQPHPNPKTRGVIVPCTLRIEINGQSMEQSFDKIGVREVYNQPGRWTIFGGI